MNTWFTDKCTIPKKQTRKQNIRYKTFRVTEARGLRMIENLSHDLLKLSTEQVSNNHNLHVYGSRAVYHKTFNRVIGPARGCRSDAVPQHQHFPSTLPEAVEKPLSECPRLVNMSGSQRPEDDLPHCIVTSQMNRCKVGVTIRFGMICHF